MGSVPAAFAWRGAATGVSAGSARVNAGRDEGRMGDATPRDAAGGWLCRGCRPALIGLMTVTEDTEGGPVTLHGAATWSPPRRYCVWCKLSARPRYHDSTCAVARGPIVARRMSASAAPPAPFPPSKAAAMPVTATTSPVRRSCRRRFPRRRGGGTRVAMAMGRILPMRMLWPRIASVAAPGMPWPWMSSVVALSLHRARVGC